VWNACASPTNMCCCASTGCGGTGVGNAGAGTGSGQRVLRAQLTPPPSAPPALANAPARLASALEDASEWLASAFEDAPDATLEDVPARFDVPNTLTPNGVPALANTPSHSTTHAHWLARPCGSPPRSRMRPPGSPQRSSRTRPTRGQLLALTTRPRGSMRPTRSRSTAHPHTPHGCAQCVQGLLSAAHRVRQ
jgi:hypothetical protein